MLSVAFLLLAAVGFGLAIKGRAASAIFSCPFYFLLVQTGAVVGIIETCLGRRFGVWDQAASSRVELNNAAIATRISR